MGHRSESKKWMRPDYMDVESQSQALNFLPVAVLKFEKWINQYNKHVFRARFFILGTIHLSTRQFFVVRYCPVHIRMLSNFPGLCSRDTITSSQLWQPKVSLKVTWGKKSPLVEKLFFRKVLLTEVCGMDRRHMRSEQGDPLEGCRRSWREK